MEPTWQTEDGRVKLWHADCDTVMREVWEPLSVDSIITDPPYPKEFDRVWDYLGAPAHRVTKNFLMTLCGHYQLPRVIQACMDGGWDWWKTLV